MFNAGGQGKTRQILNDVLANSAYWKTHSVSIQYTYQETRYACTRVLGGREMTY